MYFKETEEGGKTYLEFKNPQYEALFIMRRQDLTKYYAELLAFEEVFRKLDIIFEADLSHHVVGQIKDLREFIESSNEAIRVATNTQKGDVERKKRSIWRRKDKLYLREELVIDLDNIQPDKSEVEKHVVRLKEIFRKDF